MEQSFALLGVRLFEVSLRVNDNDESEGVEHAELEIGIDFSVDKKESLVLFKMKAGLESEALPCSFVMVFEAAFKAQIAITKKSITKEVQFTCMSEMFPYVREGIAELTRRATGVPLMLPHIDFRQKPYVRIGTSTMK